MSQKLGMGIFGGLILTYSYITSAGNIGIKLLNTSFIFTIIMGPIFLYHYFSMRRVCDKCEDKWHIPVCPIQFCLAKRPNIEDKEES